MNMAIFVRNISTLGGVEVVAIEYALKLIMNGERVHIISADMKEIPQKLQNTPVEFFPIQTKPKIGGLTNKSIDEAANYCRNKNIDYAAFMVGVPNKKVHPVCDTRLILEISKLCKTNLFLHTSPKALLERHWNMSYGFIGNVLRKTKTVLLFAPKARRFFRFLRKCNVQVFTLSRGCQNDLKRYFGIESKIAYNTYTFLERASKPKKNIALYCGRLDAEKNVFLLLNAWKTIDTKNWTLRIVGDGPQFDFLNGFCKKNNLQNVEFVGSVPHSKIFDYMEESKFFCFTSFHEGYPTVLVEAMNMGNAILTTKYDSISDELLDSSNSIVTGFKTSEYAECLETLLSDEKLAERMGKAAREKCKDFYSSKEYFENSVLARSLQ